MEQRRLLAGLEFAVVDRDPDYVSLHVFASSFRFAGSTRVYLNPSRLAELAVELSGFPADVRDERTFEFGSADLSAAGGFVSVRLSTSLTGVGTAEVKIADDPRWSAAAEAMFSFQVMSAEMDEFVAALRRLGRDLDGCARLVGCERFASPPAAGVEQISFGRD